MLRDLRHALRVLRRSPGMAYLSIVTMGVGIGVSAVLFTLVNSIVLRPLPYPEPERLVRLFDANLQAGVERAGAASGNIDDWRRRAGAFDGVAGYYAMGRTISDDAGADVLIAAQVSRDFFDVVRVAPAAGRAFTEDEFQRATFNSAAAPTGADPVVMLSHGVWQDRFGGDPSAIGRTLTIDRRAFRVVGIMPANFAMPDARVRLWIPWGIGAGSPRDQHYLGAVARLKPGISIEQAEERVNVVARELGAEFPGTNRGWTVRLSRLAHETVGDVTTILWVLFAAVGLVLLVVCANVALLSLLRGLDRRGEAAVCLALGASAARLGRESLFESAWLAALGGVMGGGLAWLGLRLLPSLAPDLPRLDEVAFDVRAVGFVVAVTALAAIISGLPELWRGSRVPPLADLSASSRRATAVAGRHWVRDGIVIAQVALAAILMMGAGLLVRSVQQLRDVDHGFDPRGVLVAPIFLDNLTYTRGEQTRTYYRTLLDRLAVLPGVVAVGAATTVPTSPLGPDFERPVWPDGAATSAADRLPASVRMVTPGYIKTMTLRVVDGREIDERDAPDAPRVLMVSETLANRVWPGQRAVGRKLVVDYSSAGTYPYEVVGVVGDLRFRGPRSQPLAEVFLPHAQRSYLIMNVVVKTSGDPRMLIPMVRAELKAVDPQVPAHGLYALDDLVGATYARDRQAMSTLTVFASAAAFLAALGVYGVLSQRVRERTREIGIRMALGADTRQVLGWVARSGLRLVLLGTVAGAVAARVISGTLSGLLFGVAPSDGVTSLAVIGALAAIGAAAVLAPALRAARIDPVQALRQG